MKKYATYLLKKLIIILEYAISLLLAVGIILLFIRTCMSIIHIPDLSTYPNYEDLLETCFNLIIGVELIRMVFQHTPSTVFEVLLFAIARQVIVDHATPLNSLIGVAAIAVLFATRKFLFCEFDESEKVIFRATQKVRLVNKLIHVHIPYEDDETLEDVIRRRLEETQEEIGVGACAYYSNFGLRIAKMHHDKISRIEVIRSIR